eukprot:9287459-Ditylum_brightwellii.AAC.2
MWWNGGSPKGTMLQKLWEFLMDLSGLSEEAGRQADPNCCVDQQLLGYIQHVNLNVLWSHSKNTVQSNLTSFRKGLRMAVDLDIIPPYQARGPLPFGDQVGFWVAL